MSERTDKDLLNDIQEAARRIAAYIAAMPYEAFLGDTKTQDAVVRNLEIIGEATKRFPMSVREQYPEIPWTGMAGMRDRIIHGYDTVDLQIVWDVVKQDIPEIKPQIQQILADYSA